MDNFIHTVLDPISSLIPPVNYSAITFDDLEHPRLVTIYKYFWEVSLVLTSIFFCFMLYMITTKSSKEMTDYKWYLVHQLSWSYIFDVYIGLWKPVPLWPFNIAYSAGIFSSLHGNYISAQLIAIAILAVGMGFSIYISLLHRYVQASPFSAFYKRYSILSHRIIIYIIIFILLQCLFCIPLSYTVSLQGELKITMTSKYPELIQMFELHPSISGFDTSVITVSVNFILIIVITLIIVTISITLLYLNFLRILRKNKQLLSVGTYKVQLMLFKTLFLQIIIAGLMLIIPITVCMVLTLFGLRWISTFSLFVISIIGCHTIVDFTILCYFIKSYREYVKMLFKRCLLKLGFKVYQTAPMFLPSPTTNSGLINSAVLNA